VIAYAAGQKYDGKSGDLVDDESGDGTAQLPPPLRAALVLRVIRRAQNVGMVGNCGR